MNTSEEFREEEKSGDDSQNISWVILSYLNDSQREFFLPYCYIFTILWCQCGSRPLLRGRVVGYGLWVQAPSSVTITQLCFFLVNHSILWKIYMTVRLMTWKEVWIYGRGWMWFQWSMEYFSNISLENVVLSVYYWDYLQVELCDLA